MKNLDAYSLSELKIIYGLLHAQLSVEPALLDSDLLHDLQVWLQQQARAAGIDVTEHKQWETWLSDRSSDIVRRGDRDVLR